MQATIIITASVLVCGLIAFLFAKKKGKDPKKSLLIGSIIGLIISLIFVFARKEIKKKTL